MKLKELEEFFINQELVVDNPLKAEEHFAKLVNGKVPVWDDIKKFTEFHKFANVYYFDSNLIRQAKCNEDTVYVWIDTGYDTKNEEPIFLALIKAQYCFSGHFVETGKNLLNKLCEHNEHNRKTYQDNYRKFSRTYDGIKVKERNIPAEAIEVEQDITEVIIQKPSLESNDIADKIFEANQVEECEIIENEFSSIKPSEITEEIISELLFPHFKSPSGLEWFLKVIGKRIKQLIELGQTEYFVMNKIESVIVNTGLMSVYGTDYLVLYRKYITNGNYIAYKVITGKSDYLREGFSVEQSNICIKPISFFDKEKDKYLPSISMKEFDLKIKSLKHIIEERKHRFPEKLQNETSEYIANIVISSLKQGLMIQQRDNTFARAIYSGTKISWLIPLRLGAKVTENLELVMVIRKCEYFYELKTILPYDDEMKDKITAVSLYKEMW